MKKVFSGIKPTGDIHIGNYLGAIKNWAKSQDANIFCIVDLHAITVKQDPKVLNSKIREVAGLLLASGINIEKSALFVQSHVSAHSEMAWILNCFTPMGWLERMTQFKEKSEESKTCLPTGRERVSVGLFDYPVLMASDILLYETDIVPVGEDQKQHVELARDLAKRFNSIYGKTFKLPEAMVPNKGARIMDLQNPKKKMSKSEEEGKNVINLLDSPDDIRSKIMSATTDSKNEIRFNEKRLGIYNLLIIYEQFSGLPREEIEKKFERKGYADFKKELAEVIIEKLKPIQKEYVKITTDPTHIDSILKKGTEKIQPLANKTLETVKTKIGLG